MNENKKYITNKLFNNFQSYIKVLACDETYGTDILLVSSQMKKRKRK